METRGFDKGFEESIDMLGYLDLASGTRPLQKLRRVNVDLPQWMIDRLDGEAGRLGVTRQSVIKMWLSERLDQARLQR